MVQRRQMEALSRGILSGMCGLCGSVNAGQFLVHSSDQCEVCRPSDVIVCDVISQAFPHHFGLLQAIII